MSELVTDEKVNTTEEVKKVFKDPSKSWGTISFNCCEPGKELGIMEMGNGSKIFYHLPYYPNGWHRFWQWVFFGFI